MTDKPTALSPPPGDGPEAQPLSVPGLVSGPSGDSRTVEAAPDAFTVAEAVKYLRRGSGDFCYHSRYDLMKIAAMLERYAQHDQRNVAKSEWEHEAETSESALTIARQRIAELEEGPLIARSILNRTASLEFPTPGEKVALEALALLAPADTRE